MGREKESDLGEIRKNKRTLEKITDNNAESQKMLAGQKVNLGEIKREEEKREREREMKQERDGNTRKGQKFPKKNYNKKHGKI